MTRKTPNRKEVPELLHVTSCACYQVRRLSRHITQIYDRHLMENGLTVTQFGLLSAIQELAPVSVSTLAETLGADRTTVTRLVQTLERDGLVQHGAVTDKRTRAISVTAEGQRAFENGIPHWKAAYRELKEKLEPLGLGALVTTLSEANALFAEETETPAREP